MKKYLLVISVLYYSNVLIAQDYTVLFNTDYFYTSDNFYTEYVEFKIKSNFQSVNINGQGEIMINGIPRELIVKSYQLNIEEYGQLIDECGPSEQTITIPLNECNEFSGSLSTTCSGFVTYSIKITPILRFETSVMSPESTIFCTTELVRLVGNPGFTSYHWNIRVGEGNWQLFSPGIGSDVSFSLEDKFDLASTNYLNKSIYFGFSVGNCPDIGPAEPISYKFAPPSPKITEVTESNPSCYGGSDGQISGIKFDRSITGESILYDLLNYQGTVIGQNSDGIFTGLASGKYFLRVQPVDISYCDNIQTKEVNLIDPSIISYTTADVDPVTCFGSATGSIAITPSGGTGSNYRFQVDGKSMTNDPVLTSLTQGDHVLKIYDENNCVLETTINIPGPITELGVDIVVTSDYNGFPISCFNSANASVELNGTGGWANYTYSNSENGSYSTTNSFSGLTSGSHTFWVKDNQGCIFNEEVIITAPSPVTISTNVEHPNCPGLNGSVEIIGAGGVGQFMYSLDGDAFQTTNLYGLASGIHMAYIRDANGCIASTEILITDPAPMDFVTQVTNPACRNSSDGEILFSNISNGTPPYETSIDGGAIYSTNMQYSQLSTGSYNVVVRDNNMCTSSALITINEPQEIEGIITESPIACFGDETGSLEVNASGGAGNYTYLWSTGEITSVISKLSAGEYSVQVTDANGCLSNSIYYNLINPPEILALPLVTLINGYSVSCSGGSDGSGEVIVSGGTIQSDYDYLWSNDQTTRALTNAPAGDYSVVVQDDNGCQATASLSITEPTPLEITNFDIADLLCFNSSDGSVSLNATGGTGGYEYSLNSGPFQTIPEFSNLNSGDYQVTVRDLSSCILVKDFTLDNPVEISVSVTELINTTCNNANGSISIEAAGGTGTLNYTWYNSAREEIGGGKNLSNVIGGSYIVNVTDNNGCFMEEKISISDSDGPTVDTQVINGVTCFDISDGSAEVLVSGGTPPYEISWQDGQSGPTANALAAGTHEITITDGSGCLSFVSIDIPIKEPIALTEVNLEEPTCFGGSDGSITLNAIGGTPPYEYNWEIGSLGPKISDLTAGEYALTIIDVNGCSLAYNVSLSSPDVLEIIPEVVEPSCEVVSDGKIELIIQGGSPPYEIFFQGTPLTTDVIADLGTGIYNFSVIDSKGCSTSTMVSLEAPQNQIIDMNNLTICSGQLVEVIAPIVGTDYQWYKGSEQIGSNSSIMVNSAGDYSVVVTSDNGCSSKGVFSVQTSSEVLNSEFLMSSTVAVGDTVIIIDITHPVPDSISWVMPQSADVLEQTNDYALLIFKEPGVFEIAMEAFLGDCYELISSSIDVIEDFSIFPGGRTINQEIPTILSLELFPNPNNGIFRVSTLLNKKHSLEVRIIHLLSNKIVYKLSRPSATEHTIQFVLDNISSGPYAIVVSSAEDKRVIRMIIN